MGGGGKDGGGSGGGSINVAPSPYEAQLASISGDIYSKTNPLRDYFIEDWTSFLRPQSTQNIQNLLPQQTTVPISSASQFQFYSDPNTGQVYDMSNSPAGIIKKPIYGEGTVNPKYANFPSILADHLPEYRINRPITGYEAYAGETQLVPINYGAAQTVGSSVGPTAATNAPLPSQRYNPYALPGYAPIYDLSRSGLEDQFNVAKQNIIGGTARGGSMYDALRQLEQGRAQSVGSMPAQISTSLIQDIMNKAYGAAWNAPSQSISGLSAANQGYVSQQNAALQAQMQQNAMQAQQSQAKGSGLGMLGMGMGSVLGGAFAGGYV